MTAYLDLSPASRAAWVRARGEYRVPLRRPEVDETPLSDDEIEHGVRIGVFDGRTGADAVQHGEHRAC